MMACECGAARRPEQLCCDRCEQLDGLVGRSPFGRFEIVQELRAAGRALTTGELAAVTGRFKGSVRRSLRTLHDAGVVRRIIADPDFRGQRAEESWALEAG